MDPVATLQQWLTENDPDERGQLARDYNEWRSNGGYPAPIGTAYVERMYRFHLHVTRTP